MVTHKAAGPESTRRAEPSKRRARQSKPDLVETVPVPNQRTGAASRRSDVPRLTTPGQRAEGTRRLYNAEAAPIAAGHESPESPHGQRIAAVVASSRPERIISERGRAGAPVAGAQSTHECVVRRALLSIIALCRQQGLAHSLQGWSAAVFQGVDIDVKRADDTPRLYSVKAQWDGLNQLHESACAAFGTATGPVIPVPGGSGFLVSLQQDSTQPVHLQRAQREQTGRHQAEDAGAYVLVWCERNTVVATESNTTTVEVDTLPPTSDSGGRVVACAETLWSVRHNAQRCCGVLGAAQQHLRTGWLRAPSDEVVKPLLSAKLEYLAPPDPVLTDAVTSRLRELQAEIAEHNSSLWAESDTYAAWVQRYGPPQEAAKWVRSAPAARLASGLLRNMQADGPLQGKRVINLMGSHGLKALALACITQRTVTVVDVSPGNAEYAQEVGAAMGAPLRYIVSDVLSLESTCPDPALRAQTGQSPSSETGHQDSREPLWGCQDWVLMEQGILHYFVDLQPLWRVVVKLLAPGGQLLLRDFHPVSTKLVTTTGKKHKVAGDYFASELTGSAAAFTKWTAADPGAVRSEVKLRRWTLGEVITAVAASGLVIVSLEEEGGRTAADAVYPKTFTLTARKPC